MVFAVLGLVSIWPLWSPASYIMYCTVMAASIVPRVGVVSSFEAVSFVVVSGRKVCVELFSSSVHVV